jgi:DNA-binding XRE family transcriptional regulator
MTQEQLAEQVDLATRYISLIEVGRSSPSLETIENIARALQVEIRDLFEFVHLQPGEITPQAIQELLQDMDDKTARTVFKMVRAAAR